MNGCLRPSDECQGYTEYQRRIVSEYGRVGPKHNLIAYRIGSTPDGVRRVIRNLSERGRLPDWYEWPIRP